MAHQVRVFPEGDPLLPAWTPGQCMCLWREDVPCPNRAEWRVQNTTNEGFSEMCTPHKEAFQEVEPEAAVVYLPLTDRSDDGRPLDYVDAQGRQWVMAACGHRCGGGVSLGERIACCPNCRLALQLGSRVPVVFPDRLPPETH